MKTEHLPFYPRPTFRTVLPSGMIVISQEHHGVKATMSLMMKSGAGNDIVPGTAHLLEHMIAGKLKREHARSYFKELHVRGGIIGAATNTFSTRVDAQSAADDAAYMIEPALRAFAECEIDADGLESEKSVVMQEARENKLRDEKICWGMRTLGVTQYNFDRPIVGTESSIQEITPQHLRDYHRRWFGKQNAVLICCSPLKHEAVLNLVSKFDFLPDTLSVQGQYQHLSFRTGSWVYRREHETDETFLRFPTDPDPALRPVATVLHSMLTTHPMGTLQQELRVKRGLVYGMIPDFATMALPSYHLLIPCRREHFEQVHVVVQEVLQWYAEGRIDEELFEVIKQRRRIATREAELESSTEDVEAVLRSGELWNQLRRFSYLEKIDAMTVQDVQQFVQKYLHGKPYARIDTIDAPRGGDPS